MKYGNHMRAPSMSLLMGSVPLKGKLNVKLLLCVFLYFIGCVDGVPGGHSAVAIIHIEIFLTFCFDPSLTSRLITGCSLNRIKCSFVHKLVDDWAITLYK